MKAACEEHKGRQLCPAGQGSQHSHQQQKDENAGNHCGEKACRPKALEGERGPGKVKLASKEPGRGAIHVSNIIT